MVDRRKILTWVIYVLSAILLVVVVFFLTLWLLNKFASPAPIILGGKPTSPIGDSFPPPPNFIKLSGLYFDGPQLLKDNSGIDKAAIFLILCQKDTDYGIIYIGETEGGINLSSDACWIDSCGGSLYVAKFWVSTEQYKTKDRQGLRKLLETENNPSCILSL
ncbi:hypothetical protein KKC65_00605 [Patescibacteria group bacterium]|nr:hypothetical protein [Patescibacteria group bacterium]